MPLSPMRRTTSLCQAISRQLPSTTNIRKYFQDDNGLFKHTVHYTARGNHDNRTWSTYNHWFYNGQTGAANWGACAAADCENFYSFDIGPVHVVSINNNQRQQDYPAGAVDWIISDLASSSAQWKLVLMKHNPAITWPKSALEQNAVFLMPIFEAGGVDLVLCGGNSPGFNNQVNGVWYQHAGMENGHGFWGIDISVAALNITYFNKNGTVNRTYQIAAAAPGNASPVAAVAATPTTGIFPLSVVFSSDGSTDSDGTIAGYSWAFGDGTTSAAPNPTHIYDAAGTYNVVLTVTDDDGATDTAGTTITVSAPVPTNVPPVAAIGASPTTGTYPAQRDVQ